jgi:AraC-like DNA-binding protein
MVLFFIAGGGFHVGLFAAVLLWRGTRGNAKANRLLGLLLVVSSFNITHPLVAILVPNSRFMADSFLTEPLQFLMAPLIAAYVRQLMQPDHRFRARFLVHAAPFAAAVAFSVSPLPGLLNRAAGFPVAAAVMWTLLLTQIFCYVVPAFAHLGRYSAALREQVSNTAGIDLGWLRWFMHVIYGLYVSYAVILVFVIHGAPSIHVRAFLSVALCAYVYAIAFRGIFQKETPRLEALDETLAESPAPAGGKYLRGSVPPEEALELQRKLEHAMESEKLYLDPELDLSAMAGRVGAARNQLSFVINQNLGKNFYDFVNEYRVREVMRLMEDGARANDKMITLAFDAGFNSKPTFNAVFKKITGRTPSDYRLKTKIRVLTNKKGF